MTNLQERMAAVDAKLEVVGITKSHLIEQRIGIPWSTWTRIAATAGGQYRTIVKIERELTRLDAEYEEATKNG